MFRRDGTEFASYEGATFKVDGLIQYAVKSKYNDVTKVWDGPWSVAWTIAIKQ
jgi:hypothetical protein